MCFVDTQLQYTVTRKLRVHLFQNDLFLVKALKSIPVGFLFSILS